jgi:hypothetical protein
MTRIILLALLCAAAPAVAQTDECAAIPKVRARMACYDKAEPPTGDAALSKPSTTPYKPVASNAAQDKIFGMLAAENARLDADIKTICRGC